MQNKFLQDLQIGSDPEQLISLFCFSGKPKLTLPLVCHNQSTSLLLGPMDLNPSLTPCLSCSRKLVSPRQPCPCSPLSPSQSSSTEDFNWPDVRELRSRYCDYSLSQKTPVSCMCSVPEQMFEGGLRRHSSCTSNLLLCDGPSGEVSSVNPCSSWDTSREVCRKRLQRANSLDPQLGSAQMTRLWNLQEEVANDSYNGYYIAAEMPLPNNPEHRMIVMEKLPEPGSESVETAKVAKEEKEANYIQIRSPTSREKISIMAVIDRCRVYQESDEYKQREELNVQTELSKSQELRFTVVSPCKDNIQKTSVNSEQKMDTGPPSIVKNLREKFQNLG